MSSLGSTVKSATRLAPLLQVQALLRRRCVILRETATRDLEIGRWLSCQSFMSLLLSLAIDCRCKRFPSSQSARMSWHRKRDSTRTPERGVTDRMQLRVRTRADTRSSCRESQPATRGFVIRVIFLFPRVSPDSVTSTSSSLVEAVAGSRETAREAA